jgi:hypothetical protein
MAPSQNNRGLCITLVICFFGSCSQNVMKLAEKPVFPTAFRYRKRPMRRSACSGKSMRQNGNAALERLVGIKTNKRRIDKQNQRETKLEKAQRSTSCD